MRTSVIERQQRDKNHSRKARRGAGALLAGLLVVGAWCAPAQVKSEPNHAYQRGPVRFAVMSGSWNGPGSNIDFGSAGNATWPQFEVRFNLGGKAGSNGSWSTYIVGHLDEKDLSGAGASAGTATTNDRLQGTAVEIGAKFQFGPVMIQGNGYTGHSIGQQFGMLTQFGKIQSTGGWAQIGFDMSKNWSLFGFWGVEDPKDSDVIASGNNRLRNSMYAGMLRWKAGPIAIGAEYLYGSLKTIASTASGDQRVNGKQISLSALYNF